MVSAGKRRCYNSSELCLLAQVVARRNACIHAGNPAPPYKATLSANGFNAIVSYVCGSVRMSSFTDFSGLITSNMDQIVRFAYRLQVTWRQDMERIIEECTQQGCNLPIERFEAACRVVAGRLDGALDEGRLEEHFEDLLKAGDRLAAVFMLLPDHCSYSLQRDANGRVEAGISLSNAIKPATVHNDDEAAALLAALAAAVQSGAHGKPAVH